MPTPKRAGADLHRDEAEPATPDEPGVGQADGQQTESVDVDDLGGGQMRDSGGASSMLPNISNKRLLIIGGILLVGLFAYYQVQNDGGSGGGDGDGGDGDGDGGSPDFEPEDEEPEDGMPNIEQDPDDPLKADEQAIDVIWGDG